MDPKIAPMHIVEPIHETSSFVNGPDDSGVSSEVNCCKAGDVHPEVNEQNFTNFVFCISNF